jgi:hypothetical protein
MTPARERSQREESEGTLMPKTEEWILDSTISGTKGLRSTTNEPDEPNHRRNENEGDPSPLPEAKQPTEEEDNGVAVGRHGHFHKGQFSPDCAVCKMELRREPFQPDADPASGRSNRAKVKDHPGHASESVTIDANPDSERSLDHRAKVEEHPGYSRERVEIELCKAEMKILMELERHLGVDWWLKLYGRKNGMAFMLCSPRSLIVFRPCSEWTISVLREISNMKVSGADLKGFPSLCAKLREVLP